MTCTNSKCKKIYKQTANSIYAKKCDISTNQRQFLVNLPAFHQLDLSTRKNKGTTNCPNRCKGERRNKTPLSHSDILNIKKSQSYYDPRSFRLFK